jgi:hypothetical protein
MTEFQLVGCSPKLAPPCVSCIPSPVRFYFVATLAYYIVMFTINFEDGIRVR